MKRNITNKLSFLISISFFLFGCNNNSFSSSSTIVSTNNSSSTSTSTLNSTTKTNSSSTIENEFTGLLKNYNVISIMIETGSQYMVNPTLTPTLYKMQEEGLDFNINYILKIKPIFLNLSELSAANLLLLILGLL